MKKYASEPTINVGILTANEINFELYGDFEFDGKRHSGIYSAHLVKGKIVCKKDKEKIAEVNELFFKTMDPYGDSFLIKDVIIGVKFHWERKEKQRFLGSIKIIIEDG